MLEHYGRKRLRIEGCALKAIHSVGRTARIQVAATKTDFSELIQALLDPRLLQEE